MLRTTKVTKSEQPTDQKLGEQLDDKCISLHLTEEEADDLLR
jgi:hypothetical protein